MTYQHGVYVAQKPYTISRPATPTDEVIVYFGTAPIYLIDDPSSAVNEPILIRNRTEAEQKLGFSNEFEKYTLNQAIDACFVEHGVTPVVFVNVLDPDVHSEEKTANVTIKDNEGKLPVDAGDVLLNSINIDGLIKNEDYVVGRDQNGRVVISILSPDKIENDTINVNFNVLDPSKVTVADIIGGYDSSTNTYTGLELLRMVYPKLTVLPKIVSVPGFSHYPSVGALIAAKMKEINGVFNAFGLIDVEGENEEEAITYKSENGFNNGSTIVCWPKIKSGSKEYWYSAYLAAEMAKQDAESDGVPYRSPSNRRILISGLITPGGKEIFLDQLSGNHLNARGIITAVNIAGWRTWGNGTAAFDDRLEEIEIKDRFAVMRRMFDWWGNSFIINYFSKVDNPTNYRLIESVVDSENIRANGFQAAGQIAGARIEFRREDNPENQLLDGKIKFIQRVAFFAPAEVIENELEFDPTILMESLFGGA